jgi:hypothetical protein
MRAMIFCSDSLMISLSVDAVLENFERFFENDSLVFERRKTRVFE